MSMHTCCLACILYGVIYAVNYSVSADLIPGCIYALSVAFKILYKLRGMPGCVSTVYLLHVKHVCFLAFILYGVIYAVKYSVSADLMPRCIYALSVALKILCKLRCMAGCVSTIDIHRRYQNLCPFYPGMGLKLGVFGFSHNHNNRSLLGTYVTCIYCNLSVKINMSKTLYGVQRLWTHLFCICFCVCGRQKPEDPQFDPHARRSHYIGRYTRSGISLCISMVSTVYLTPYFRVYKSLIKLCKGQLQNPITS